MGIIKQQSIKGAIATYIGVFVGFVTTAILMPKLGTELVGLINILLTYTIVIVQLTSLGFGNVTTRMFSYFRDNSNNHNGFMFIAFSMGIIGTSLAFIAIFSVRFILQHTRSADDLFLNHILYLLPMVLLYHFTNIFDNYYKVNYKTVRGVVLREVMMRTAMFLVIMAMILKLINLPGFMVLYVLAFGSPGIIFMFLLVNEKQLILKPQLKFITKDLKKTMFSVGLYGILAGTSGIIAVNIDKIMIESIIGLSDTGIYAIAFYFGAMVSIPSRPLIKISSAIIAESWKNNDLENIKQVYQKSTITQLIVGSLLFLGIVINIDNIFIILTDTFAAGRQVMILIALAFLCDMAAGTSGQIISYSKHYKLQTYLLVFYVILIIIGNAILIPRLGIVGAAIATLFAKLLFNLAKVVTVYKLFKLFPFNLKNILVIMLILILLAINYIIPNFNNYVIDIFIRSSIISILFISAVYFLKLSSDISDSINTIFSKIFSK